MKWEVWFDEHGGYDCITDAWVISRNACVDPENGEKIVIDCKDFGQNSWKDREEGSIDRAEVFADKICAALNAAEGLT